eukprot:Nitzschia sp. Nitz4//scaffold146_size56529//2598//4351//NITZ4_006568-RA/size56529-processed-gene-0.48-mRNA-1//1//CDS//3329536611//215//frame0
MGTTLSSTSAVSQTVEQQDIQYLGDRMPFGDAELIHMYRIYQALKALPARTSFWIDVGTLAVPQDEQESRRKLLHYVEDQIFGSVALGDRLYQTSFSCSHNLPYSQLSVGESSMMEDEFTRRSNLEAFFAGVSDATRRGNTKSLQVLLRCCQPQSAPEQAEAAAGTRWIDPLEFVTMAYRVALASAFLSDDSDVDIPNLDPSSSAYKELTALASSLVEYAARMDQRRNRSTMPTSSSSSLSSSNTLTPVTEEHVQAWAEQTVPMLSSALATLVHHVFFPGKAYPPSRTRFDFPTLAGVESAFFYQGSSPLLWSLGCMSLSLGGEYYRLYTSASDGLSFNRLQNALLGYGGPTLLVIQSGESMFGAFTASAWKESKDFYGNHDCFLYQLAPSPAVYRPSGSASNFMYCNSYARSRGYDKQAHGIGFGGTVDQPRLFLAESFDDCRAAAQDLTFESGRLLDNKSNTFDIDNLEVWGVGGTEIVQEALGARSRTRDIKQAAITKARKVDKAQFLDDFRTGLIESKAFAHRQQIRGREGASVDDEDPENYKYEEDGITY